MKILLATILSFFLVFMSREAEAPVEWQEEMVYDFGDIVRNKEVSVVFPFKNLGTDSIYIDNVRTSCGCTTPDWEEIAVAPDSVGHIHISYDAEDIGEFSKAIKVYFNGYRKAERLRIEGFVEEL